MKYVNAVVQVNEIKKIQVLMTAETNEEAEYLKSLVDGSINRIELNLNGQVKLRADNVELVALE